MNGARCRYCGTEWEYETRGNRAEGGGMSGFIDAAISAHIERCQYLLPAERLAYIERNEKRLAKKPNLHTVVKFDRKHPGVQRE